MGAVAINFFLILHVGTCILYLVGCPAAKCKRQGWTFDRGLRVDKLVIPHFNFIKKILDGSNICEEGYYFCSFYFMTCIITWAGVGDICPRTVPEMLVLVCLIVCTKFIMAIFIGDISAMVQSYSHCLVNYDHGIVKLKVTNVFCYKHFLYKESIRSI